MRIRFKTTEHLNQETGNQTQVCGIEMYPHRTLYLIPIRGIHEFEYQNQSKFILRGSIFNHSKIKIIIQFS